MTTYSGIFVQRLTDGTIYSVQVRDSAGNQNALEPATYSERGIQPPIDSLPTKEDYDRNVA
jgi:hypothetical protein